MRSNGNELVQKIHDGKVWRRPAFHGPDHIFGNIDLDSSVGATAIIGIHWLCSLGNSGFSNAIAEYIETQYGEL